MTNEEIYYLYVQSIFETIKGYIKLELDRDVGSKTHYQLFDLFDRVHQLEERKLKELKNYDTNNK